jgi:hypothetical protein
MNQFKRGDTVDIQVRGSYEVTPTDTTRLSGELARPQDVTKVISNFDNGLTQVRDIGQMTIAQRQAILQYYQSGDLTRLARTQRGVISAPVTHLHTRVLDGMDTTKPTDQPVGHNFFVNATGFRDASLPWAIDFDDTIARITGHSLYEIAAMTGHFGKDLLLAELTDEPDDDILLPFAAYLAGRSLEGERFLYTHYGEHLKASKVKAFKTTQEIAVSTGLRIDMLERAAKQLQRTTFGGFDHLVRLVTSGNTDVMADYQRGTLRVDVMSQGTVQSAELQQGVEAMTNITHESFHALSAQTEVRTGLRLGPDGLAANEGLTNYLTQLALGTDSAIERNSDGSSRLQANIAYPAGTLAMLALHEQFKSNRNRHFAVLFNAYMGDTRSATELEDALETFYALEELIRQN